MASPHLGMHDRVAATGLGRTVSEPDFKTVLGSIRMRPLLFLRAALQSYRIIRAFRPHAVVSTGAAFSIPTVIAAFLLRIPVVLLFMETPISTGQVAHKLMMPLAECVLLFDEGQARLLHPTRAQVVGPILDPEFDNAESPDLRSLGLEPQWPLILVTFGSEGAPHLVRTVLEAARAGQLREVNLAILDQRLPSRDLEPFRTLRDVRIWHSQWSPLAPLVSRSSVVLTRAGFTPYEALYRGKPVLVIPHPRSRGQNGTAEYLRGKGIAVLEERDASPAALAGLVLELLSRPITGSQDAPPILAPNGTRRAAEIVLALAREGGAPAKPALSRSG